MLELKAVQTVTFMSKVNTSWLKVQIVTKTEKYKFFVFVRLRENMLYFEPKLN